LRRGAALLRETRHAAARQAFADFLHAVPGPDGWQAVGNAYLAEGQLPETITALQQMQRLDPDSEREAVLLGLLLVLDGEGSRAVTVLSRAAHRDANPRLWNLLGQQLQCLGRHLDAIQAYARATGLAPGEWRYWRNLGEAYERLGHHEQALEAYREALARRSNPEAWSAIGRVFLALRSYPAAVEAYQEAVKLAPRDLDALAGLGMAYGAQKDWPGALDTYYRVKAVDEAAGAELFALMFRGKQT
jgi:tetratricopeptide (TPR) repeat protein